MSANFFTSSLLLIFVTLKLTKNIDWSWWWVLSPFWIPAAITIVGFAGIALVRLAETPNERAARLCREMARRLSR